MSGRWKVGFGHPTGETMNPIESQCAVAEEEEEDDDDE